MGFVYTTKFVSGIRTSSGMDRPVIGTDRGLNRFEVDSQTYFQRGLPDIHGLGRFTEIAEGCQAVLGGYPRFTGTHLSEFMDSPPTGKKVTRASTGFGR